MSKFYKVLEDIGGSSEVNRIEPNKTYNHSVAGQYAVSAVINSDEILYSINGRRGSIDMFENGSENKVYLAVIRSTKANNINLAQAVADILV